MDLEVQYGLSADQSRQVYLRSTLAEQTTPQSLAISDTATRQSMEEGKRVLTLAQPACWQQINGGEVAEVVDLNFTDEADVSLD